MISEALPSGWVTKQLGELGRWSGGGTPSKANPKFWTNGTIPWVSPKDMKTERIYDSEDHITAEAVANSATHFIRKGAVLVVVRSGILRHSLPVAIAERDVTLNQDLKAVELADGVCSEYVAWALRAAARDILHTCAKGGTTVQNLEMPRFLSYRIPLAPLHEQQRIVAEIEKQFTRLEAGVASLKRVQAALKRYRASVLKAACEGRLVPTEAELARRESRSYEHARTLLEKVLEERRQKSMERSKQGKVSLADPNALLPLPDGWTWTSGSQLFVWSSGEGLTQSKTQPGPFPVFGGNGITGYHNAAVSTKPTLVVGRVGALCGNVYLTDGPAWITDNAIYAKLTPSMTLLKYIHLVFSRAELNKRSAGSGQPFVNQRMLNETLIPMPPLDEQHRIVAEAERRLSVIEELEAVVAVNLQRATRLRQSVLARAFSGDLLSREEQDAKPVPKAQASEPMLALDFSTPAMPEPRWEFPTPKGWERAKVFDFAEREAARLGYVSGGDLWQIVRGEGGRIHKGDLETISDTGRIIVRGTREFLITLGSNSGRARQRFTIAHELGHYFLHSERGRRAIKVNREGSGQLEREAHWFASAFLVPGNVLLQKMRDGLGLAQLAEYFGVSQQVIEIRTKEL